MKRLLVFAALVAVLALSVSFAGPGTSFAAIPSCEDIDREPCSPDGAKITCVTLDRVNSSCACKFGQWLCLL